MFLEVDGGPIVPVVAVPMTTAPPVSTAPAKPGPVTWDTEKVNQWFSEHQLDR